MPGEFIISGFGLQALKTKVYQTNIGKELGVNGSSFPTIELEETENLAINGDTSVPGSSMLGTSVFADIELYTDNLRVYFETVLIDVSQEKNIVKTAINGRKGTIKEYISDGDFQVNIRGAIVALMNSYPKEEVQNLIDIVDQPINLKVNCPFLAMFGIYEIVVENYSLPQKEGFENVQLFELSCVSDLPIELIEDA